MSTWMTISSSTDQVSGARHATLDYMHYSTLSGFVSCDIFPGDNVLKAGRYDWKFSAKLMPYLPASFDGNHGRVNYWCKVVIERPWKDIEITKNFSVVGQLDLNTDPDAKVREIIYIYCYSFVDRHGS